MRKMDRISIMTPDRSNPAEAFAKWWASTGSLLSSDEPEALVRTTWDAAIRAAVNLLNEEKDRLVCQASYDAAATFRDCVELAAKLFTTPSQWNHMQQFHERAADRDLEFFRGLPTEQIESIRATTRPGTLFALAAELVLRERHGDADA